MLWFVLGYFHVVRVLIQDSNNETDKQSGKQNLCLSYFAFTQTIRFRSYSRARPAPQICHGLLVLEFGCLVVFVVERCLDVVGSNQVCNLELLHGGYVISCHIQMGIQA